jgi:methyltransferase (TIGR00027 family)
MSKFGVGSTSDGAAFCRAVEQYLPEKERLFNDPLIYELMSGFYQWMLRSSRIRQYIINRTEATTKGLYGEQVCRTRYIDETVIAALKKGIRQMVILGAGLDTRAYRLPGMAQVQIFELDMPRVQKGKQARVAKVLGKVPENVHFVPIDFGEQDLGEVMQSSGFNSAKSAIFVWEAVTQYLTAEAVARTLRAIGKCAKGSRLVFTYVLRWIIEHPERDREAMAMMRLAKMKMAPFIFGLEPNELSEYLKNFHLRVIEDVGDEYYRKNWLEPMGRKLDVTFGERICLAEVF